MFLFAVVISFWPQGATDTLCSKEDQVHLNVLKLLSQWVYI